MEEEAGLETGIKIKVPLKLLKVRERYHDEGSPELKGKRKKIDKTVPLKTIS